jgi:hypothetical protein
LYYLNLFESPFNSRGDISTGKQIDRRG